LKRIAVIVVCFALFGLGNVTMAQNSPRVAPDNSAINVRDRDPNAMTASEQSNVKSNAALTRQIRRSVTNDHSLSTPAHCEDCHRKGLRHAARASEDRGGKDRYREQG
jgi:hypothetical protein